MAWGCGRWFCENEKNAGNVFSSLLLPLPPLANDYRLVGDKTFFECRRKGFSSFCLHLFFFLLTIQINKYRKRIFPFYSLLPPDIIPFHFTFFNYLFFIYYLNWVLCFFVSVFFLNFPFGVCLCECKLFFRG